MLPPVDRLEALAPEAWRALGERFRAIGFTGKACEPFNKLAAYALEPLHAPMAKWHLRRIAEPFAWAMRMFVFWDPVTLQEARRVLGDELPLERMLEVGLLVRTADGGVVSPFVMQVLGGLYVLSDDLTAGGDAVMGAAPTTRGLALVSRPRGRVARALDLGCGAGTVALGLAASCDRVVATDISERAIALARANVSCNGLSNVECRVGDMFAPVAGEVFDVISSQPPWVAGEGPLEAQFMAGGPRGDELPVRLLRGLRDHLAPGALAAVLLMWPVVEGDPPLEARVREALGPGDDLSALVLLSTDADLDEHCTRYARVGHAGPIAEYEEEAMRRRDHLERMRIRALKPTLTFVRRGAPGAAWTSCVQSRGFAALRVSRERVEALLDAHDLLARGPAALGAARLRIPEGVNLAQQGDEVQALLDARQLGQPQRMSTSTARLLALVHESDNVQDGIERLAEAAARPMAEVRDRAVEAIRDALSAGLLEIAPPA